MKPTLSMQAAGIAEENASVWRRFMSAGYESVILFGVVFFFGYAFSALFRVKFTGNVSGSMLAFQVWMFCVLGFYFAWFWSNGRRTLPMKTMAITLVDARGQAPSPYRAFARYFIAGLLFLAVFALMKWVSYGLIPLLAVPFLWALFDRQKRTLYDIAAGTRLILSDPRAGL
jgi:uncharacterized RDD family membrane protein YckC